MGASTVHEVNPNSLFPKQLVLWTSRTKGNLIYRTRLINKSCVRSWTLQPSSKMEANPPVLAFKQFKQSQRSLGVKQVSGYYDTVAAFPTWRRWFTDNCLNIRVLSVNNLHKSNFCILLYSRLSYTRLAETSLNSNFCLSIKSILVCLYVCQ